MQYFGAQQRIAQLTLYHIAHLRLPDISNLEIRSHSVLGHSV